MFNNCRTCSKEFDVEECVNIGIKIIDEKSILDLVKEWASVETTKDDTFPQFICKLCFISVKSFVKFIRLIQKSDKEFKELVSRNRHEELDRLPQETKNTNVSENNLSKSLIEGTYGHCKLISEDPANRTSEFIKNIQSTKKSGILPLSRNNIVRPFECITCHKTFKKSYQYKTHMTVHTGERKYSCTVCGKQFARSYILIYHMRVHTGEKKFKCSFCNKSFIHPSNLYKHKKIHTNTRNYKCEFCFKSFIQSEALKIHVRRIHTGEKPFLCEMCSKSFSCQSALWLHKQDTHMQKVTCPLCKKQFSRRILKQHIERHKNKEEQLKKCICEQCGKNFSSAHNLRQHLLIHDGIKPYATQPTPCPLCKKSYSKRRIKSHICISSND